jgi:hypothetical protein
VTEAWPELPFAAWADTCATLQLWTQVVGKIRLAHTPTVNHWWNVPLYVTSRGLTTSLIPHPAGGFQIDFDFIDHRLKILTCAGAVESIALQPRSVAEFHAEVMGRLRSLGLETRIWTMPVEIENAIPFEQDRTHAAYDAEYANRFSRVLLQVDRLMKRFRSPFLGKVSPVHFFWGSFDLAVTRFSGRRAPLHPGGVPGLPDAVTREAYSHEVSSAGFWPGNDMFPQAAFYSYAWPEPPGFRDCTVPEGASFNGDLGEFILTYDVLRAAPDPDTLLLDFLSASYAAAAGCGHWDREALECELGVPGRVRPI